MNPISQAYQCPLTDEHCARLDAVLTRNAGGLQLAKDCAECGLDTSEYINQFQAQNDLAAKLKRKFFPHRS